MADACSKLFSIVCPNIFNLPSDGAWYFSTLLKLSKSKVYQMPRTELNLLFNGFDW